MNKRPLYPPLAAQESENRVYSPTALPPALPNGKRGSGKEGGEERTSRFSSALPPRSSLRNAESGKRSPEPKGLLEGDSPFLSGIGPEGPRPQLPQPCLLHRARVAIVMPKPEAGGPDGYQGGDRDSEPVASRGALMSSEGERGANIWGRTRTGSRGLQIPPPSMNTQARTEATA